MVEIVIVDTPAPAPAELGRKWITQNSTQPNPVHEHMGRPVALIKFTNTVVLGYCDNG